jgi:hypothetical protein
MSCVPLPGAGAPFDTPPWRSCAARARAHRDARPSRGSPRAWRGLAPCARTPAGDEPGANAAGHRNAPQRVHGDGDVVEQTEAAGFGPRAVVALPRAALSAPPAAAQPRARTGGRITAKPFFSSPRATAAHRSTRPPGESGPRTRVQPAAQVSNTEKVPQRARLLAHRRRRWRQQVSPCTRRCRCRSRSTGCAPSATASQRARQERRQQRAGAGAGAGAVRPHCSAHVIALRVGLGRAKLALLHRHDRLHVL